ncbi:MAG: hypothetical protein V3R16_06135, partial [Nitrospirales bacterium]
MRITLRLSVRALLIGFNLTILLLAGSLQAAGQSTDPPRPRNLRFEHFDANDGAYSIITDILQDRQGF